MLKTEYGKEKKKKIYGSMYDPALQFLDDGDSTFSSIRQESPQPNIRLNLSKETTLKPNRNTHVKLKTISPRGEVKEEMVPLNETTAELMNTTVNSLAIPGDASLRSSQTSGVNPWSSARHSPRRSPRKQAKKHFYLFSPAHLQQANVRYSQEIQRRKEEGKDSQSDIVNIEIPVNRSKNAGNQINLGYVNAHEQNLSEAYLGQIIKDEPTGESTTGLVSTGQFPFGRIYSRLSKDASKLSQNEE